jgi:ribose transport system substrate-binding protein
VKKGAEQAAADFGVEITFDGPPTESDIAIQVDMLKSALDKQPAAIALAALDTESVNEQLNACKNNGIPVIGFDSGVPNAPEGSIYATASTNNSAAAAIAAEKLFENVKFAAKLAAASAAAPIQVGVLSQDATSDSIVSRTSGFIDRLVELVGDADVEVTGHDKFAKSAANGAKLIITVSVPATTSAADMKSGAEAMLTSGKYAAIYGSNENGAGGMLAASNDGSDFAEGAKYGDVIAIGFDAGKTQRTAVENGWFYGAVTQDPYSIGYKAVELSVDAINKKPISDPIVDTGAKWYNSENLSDPAISELVYE